MTSIGTALALVVFLFFCPPTANALLTGATPPCTLNNALTQCSAQIQRALQKYDAKRWGAIQFNCENGFLKTIQASTTSRLAASWEEFVLGYPEIFGLRSNGIHIDDYGDRKFFGQQWHGLYIDYTRIEGSPDYDFAHAGQPEKAGRIFHLHSQLVDTHAWHLNSVPSISSSSAAQAAIAIWKKAVPARTMKVDSVDLRIYARGTTECGTAANPRLVWSLYGTEDAPSAGYVCMIDAQTGKPCDPKYCLEPAVRKL